MLSEFSCKEILNIVRRSLTPQNKLISYVANTYIADLWKLCIIHTINCFDHHQKWHTGLFYGLYRLCWVKNLALFWHLMKKSDTTGTVMARSVVIVTWLECWRPILVVCALQEIESALREEHSSSKFRPESVMQNSESDASPSPWKLWEDYKQSASCSELVQADTLSASKTDWLSRRLSPGDDDTYASSSSRTKQSSVGSVRSHDAAQSTQNSDSTARRSVRCSLLNSLNTAADHSRYKLFPHDIV